MNDGQIYRLCHQKPGIKATEIANVLNAELLVVSNALRSLVDVGDLVKSKKFDDETGRSSQVYELSDEFKRSRHFKDMLGMMNQVQIPAPPAPAQVVAEVAQPSPAVGKLEAAPENDGLSKVERAVRFVTRHGAASDAELRDVMGLPEKATVSSYIAPATKNGRLHRAPGGLWKPGTGQPPMSPEVIRGKLGLATIVKDQGNVVSVGNLVVATRDQTPVPAATVAQLAGAKPSAPPKAAAKPFRCALWTDGVLEIHREEGVVRLTPDQVEELARLLHRDWMPV